MQLLRVLGKALARCVGEICMNRRVLSRVGDGEDGEDGQEFGLGKAVGIQGGGDDGLDLLGRGDVVRMRYESFCPT